MISLIVSTHTHSISIQSRLCNHFYDIKSVLFEEKKEIIQLNCGYNPEDVDDGVLEFGVGNCTG